MSNFCLKILSDKPKIYTDSTRVFMNLFFFNIDVKYLHLEQ